MIMHLQSSKRGRSAFTLIDLVFIVGTVLILFMIFPLEARTKARASRIACLSNLKQIGLAFRMWAAENGHRFPMELMVAEGGTRETVRLGLPLPSYTIISNQLNNPKPLHCPDDSKRIRVATFAQLTPKNLSYFLGVDPSETNPGAILTGDRNLRINGQPTYRVLQTTNWSAVTWGAGIHQRQGNIGLADGSVQQVNDSSLQRQLQASGLATNRFAIP